MRALLTPLLLLFLTLPIWGQNISPNPNAKPPDKSKKVSQVIYEIRDLRQSIAMSEKNIWETYKAKVVGDSIQVDIAEKYEISDSYLHALENYPGRIQRHYENHLQMIVPLSNIEWLEDQDDIVSVNLPIYAQYLDIISEGIDTLGIPKYQEKGHLGQGTKIAILDGGFQNYSFFKGSELPMEIGTMQFGLYFESSKHGTQCAQVIYDEAPSAEFWLIQIDTNLDFLDACDWIKSQGFDIISCSLAFFNTGWNDGSSFLSQKINELSANGILWVNSAANHAERHWSALFYDSDYDGYNEFSIGDEVNDIYLYAGQTIDIFLEWNDWPLSNNDYDLYLYRAYPFGEVASSVSPQTGLQSPKEHISFTPLESGNYGVVIKKYMALENSKFHLFITTSSLQYLNRDQSIPVPGDAFGSLTVGAVAWSSPHTIESFSSRGPTSDYRIKPELVAPDSITVKEIAGTSVVQGTSFSCPHIAGAAAVYLSYKPEVNPADIIDSFKTMCIDLGDPGPDNTYGWGLLHLPDPNRAPYFYGMSTNYIINENQNYQLQINAVDPDQDYLIYSASNLPEGADFDIVSHYFLWQPTYEQSGNYQNVRFIASDGQLSDTIFISFTVLNTNRPPTIAAIDDKNIDENQSLIFNVEANDPDTEDNLSYWSKNLPSGAAFSSVAGSFAWMPTYEQAGTYSGIILGVTDTRDSASDTISITVNNVNRPPSAFGLFYPINQDSIETDTVTLIWSSSNDPDTDDELTYKLYYSESDTSTWQHIIEDIQDTTYLISDLSLINNPYYWKVICNDGYSAQASCNSTFKFISADITPPSFTINILPNPVFGNELDVFAYPSENITASPEIIYSRQSISDTTDMVALTNRNLLSYIADYRIDVAGSYNISVCGSDAAGNEGCSNLGFAAAPLFVGSPAYIEDKRSGLYLYLNGNLVERPGIIVSKKIDNDFLLVHFPFGYESLSTFELLSNNSFESGYADLTIFLDQYKNMNESKDPLALIRYEDGNCYLIPAKIDHVANTFNSSIKPNGIFVLCKSLEDHGNCGENQNIATSYNLYQNVPNPFNATTVIRFSLPQPEHVQIDIYNILGRNIRSLTNEYFDSGMHEVPWDGKDQMGTACGSGIYFYRIKAGILNESKRMLLLK